MTSSVAPSYSETVDKYCKDTGEPKENDRDNAIGGLFDKYPEVHNLLYHAIMGVFKETVLPWTPESVEREIEGVPKDELETVAKQLSKERVEQFVQMLYAAVADLQSNLEPELEDYDGYAVFGDIPEGIDDLALLLRRTALNWMKENVRRFVE